MAFVCFVYVCDVRYIDKRGLCMLPAGGRVDSGQGYPPPPSGVERRLGYPQANFFYFFQPIPITSSIYPFFLFLRGFLFLCVYFLICVSFRGSEGKKRLFLSYLYLCGYYALYSHSIFSFSIIFLSCISLLFYSLCYVLALSFVVDAVFFADLPILLPSVGLSLLLCVIIRLGVFRGSEAKK